MIELKEEKSYTFEIYRLDYYFLKEQTKKYYGEYVNKKVSKVSKRSFSKIYSKNFKSRRSVKKFLSEKDYISKLLYKNFDDVYQSLQGLPEINYRYYLVLKGDSFNVQSECKKTINSHSKKRNRVYYCDCSLCSKAGKGKAGKTNLSSVKWKSETKLSNSYYS